MFKIFADVDSTLFSIKLHHGGLFTKSPNRKYSNGNITFVDLIDCDQFSIHEIDSILEDLGHDGHRVMFYHFLKPDCDLDNGLEPLACDKDVQVLAKYVTQGLKLVEVYVEHEKTNPDIYTPPKKKKLVIEELDNPITSKAGIYPVAKKLVLDVTEGCLGQGKGESSGKVQEPCVVNLEEGQSSAADNHGSSQVPSQFVNDFYSSYDPYVESQDPNYDPFADLDIISPIFNNTEGNASENVETEFENATEFEKETDVHSENEVDNERTVELEDKSGDDSQREDDDDTERDDDDDDSQDSDYLAEEDYDVDEVDVDMENFEYNVDETAEFMGCKDTEEDVDNEDVDPDAEDINELENEYFESASGSDSEGSRLRKKRLKQLRKQAHAADKIYKTFFYVGKQFPNREHVKEYIKEHAIETRRRIRMEKNDNERVRAVCKGVIPSLPTGEAQNLDTGVSGPSQSTGSKVKWTKKTAPRSSGYSSPSKVSGMKEKLFNGGKPNSKKKVHDPNKCTWVVLVSKLKESETWQVKTHRSEHKCLQERENLYATYDWFSRELVEQLKSNPNIPVRAVQEQLQQKHELSVSESKAFRAKQQAERKLRGDYTHQYKMLRDYVLELQQTNPNTTVKIHVQPEADHMCPTRVFKRIYVCLGPLKDGFKAGMRDLLGLDGAFMKGPYPGQLLTAVSVDPNNGIYPLAYGIVETENTESWTWFLNQLGDDLDLYRNSNFTFISDRQKVIYFLYLNI